MNSIEKTVEDYEVRYKNLHKFFYSREFFYDWDEKNNLEIEFHNSQVEGYWNNEFVLIFICIKINNNAGMGNTLW